MFPRCETAELLAIDVGHDTTMTVSLSTRTSTSRNGSDIVDGTRYG